jgi:hypothetical protein
MKELMKKLFKEQYKSAEILLADKDTYRLLEAQVAKALLNNDKIILEEPICQLRLIISNMSTFANSKEECDEVTNIIIWGMKNEDLDSILPMVTEHQGYDLAKRCLISISFFENHMIQRHNRYAAPSPNFYRKIGAASFIQSGHQDIGEHFDKWSLFIKEFFV